MARPVVPKPTRGEVFFAVTLFVSAALLFVVQPMFAKMVLPLLGGAPAVWNTCLVFYQAALLAGYLYAHLSLKWLGPRRQAALHLLLLCVPWTVLPIGVADGWLPPPDAFPVPWLWMLLSVSVGLPFLVVSASAPMLQTWFSQTGGRAARDPYFLYAASNLGSLLALLSYPLLIESQWTLREQAWGWAAGYGVLTALVAGCAVQLWRSPAAGWAAGKMVGGSESTEVIAERPSWRRRLWWLALSMVPSSLLLGVTTYISTDLAAIPLLWVLPLALYLSTFVLVFARRSLLPLPRMIQTQPYLIVAAAGSLAWSTDMSSELLLIGSLQLLAFFVTAMVCHGQLAGDRPSGSRLTEFYLWMSLGGVLGGLLNALVAPLVFSSAAEYPLMMAAACLLRPPAAAPLRGAAAWARQFLLPAVVLLVCGGLTWIIWLRAAPLEWGYADLPLTKWLLVASAAVAAFFLRRRPLSFGLGVAALLAVSLGYPEEKERLLHAERSFFGVLRVMDAPLWNAHHLMHGSTCHGSQSLDRHERHDPWVYYSRGGPLGRIFEALQPRRPLANIGALGLGAGAIAAYGQPGERITFYEIDPAVARIARDPQYFTYLADCRAKLEVILGDARVSLVHGPPRKFDLLVLDVFSSDSVPVHLVTREALKIYLERLADHGLLAIHTSSRYLDVRPILGRLAQDAGLTARTCKDRAEGFGPKRSTSIWVVMARQAEDLGQLARDPDWKPLLADGGRVWTDDFSNVVATLQFWFPWDWLDPSGWWVSKKGSEAHFHISVGRTLCRQGRFDEGMAHFRKALDIDPDYADAYNDLGAALASRGQIDQAIDQFKRTVEINPDHVEAHFNLGKELAERGRLEEAMVHYQKVMKIQPSSAVHNNVGLILATQGRFSEAMAHYQAAMKMNPDDVEVQKNLAWLRATCPEATLRNSAQALELAQRANGLCGGKRADVLDTLAAAYAATGRFPEARTIARKALDLAVQQNNRALADALPARIALYEAGEPYRQTPSPSPPVPPER